ncbi:MAG: hypothetical protein JO210_05960 [Acidobacteriaceae bacterium]|nr:hypothetical protein [Acidobacteriaceae bacterium]
MADSQGIRVYLGPTERGSALQFLDHERHLRAQIGADEQSSQIHLQNERYEATLAVGSLPGFSMGENNKARLGFGLESDDTGSTSQQQWVFYSGGTGQNLRAVFGSGIPYGARDRQIRGFLDVCCNKNGNFWEAPPANDIYDWSRVKK